jgi:RNA polymerase sigma-70 factor (ECF subfamily)
MAVSVFRNQYWISSQAVEARAVNEPGVNVQDNVERAPLWDEDDLVHRAQTGDAEAFERLYEIYVRRMYALSLRMVSDHQRAEELTQDIFIRTWETIKSFRFESAFGTWLHRLGTNVVLGHIRSQKRHENRITETPDLEQFESGLRMAMPETKMDLEKAIAMLPRGAKEVLILHDIEGYRYREIAEMTEVAEGTVKSQLNRARRLVREALLK